LGNVSQKRNGTKTTMSYQRKTTRPNWQYTLPELQAMAKLAAATSLWHAAEALGASWATVRKACRLTGLEPRRRPCNAIAKAKALRLRAKGQTYAQIGRVVGYNQQSVFNWCRDAELAVDCRRKAA
jgi:transposase-like protein